MTFEAFRFNRNISKAHIDNLSSKWNEVKQVANKMQMNDRDKYIINGELTTNLTQYLGNAKQNIDPADEYRRQASMYSDRENNHVGDANRRKRHEDHFNKRADHFQRQVDGINRQYNNVSTQNTNIMNEYNRRSKNLQNLNNQRNELIRKANNYQRQSRFRIRSRRDRSRRDRSRQDRDNALNSANDILKRINYINKLGTDAKNIQKYLNNLTSAKTAAESNRNNFRNRANRGRQLKEEQQRLAADARKNKEDNIKKEADLRTKINNNYRAAETIYDQIYNKIYPELQKTANEGVVRAGTAMQSANATITLDNKSLPQATSLDTQTSITNNIVNSNAVLDNQNSVNLYNQRVSNRRTPISDVYSYANSAKTTGETANTKSIALQQQANELAITAGQEKKVADEIALKKAMITDTQVFISEYINKNLSTITTNFNKFITNLTNTEIASQTTLNTPFNKTPAPTNVIGNIDASTAENNKSIIEQTYSDKYKFVNFKINTAVSYPLKCIGPTENAKTSQMNMTPLDNNLHTYKTCKRASNLANKPYYALVKPTDPNTTLYNCYVADTAPPQNASNYDYAIIWENGPSTSTPAVSKFGLSASGDFVIMHADNTTTNISKINTDLYSGRKFYLRLTDKGNLEIHAYTTPDQDTIAWQSFSIQSVRKNMMDLIHYTPVSNNAWGAMNAQNEINQSNPISTVLVSSNNQFKLEIKSDGNLQLKAAVYGCKYTDTVDGNSKLSNTNFLYTDKVDAAVKGQSYYVYANDTRLPAVQTPYYATNAQGYQTLQQVDWSNPSLANSNSYDIYPSIFMTNENGQVQNNGEIQTVNTEAACIEKCNSEPSCNYAYFYNGNQCYIGKKNKPEYVPNKNSNLYIRKKKMNLKENPFKISSDYTNIEKNNVLSYSPYNILPSTITSEFVPGPPTNKNYVENDKIVKSTIYGNSSVSGSTSKIEGFDNRGYEDPSIKYCTYPNELGCSNAILQNQITPLTEIAQDYQKKTLQMNRNKEQIRRKINNYKHINSKLNSHEKYDFSGNQPFSMEDTTILNVMQEDTKQLLLQENNFYIAGSILTTTLLISAIYLAR
jgi:hypothetical protein